MHRSAGFKEPVENPKHKVNWFNVKDTNEWLNDQPVKSWKDFFSTHGYLVCFCGFHSKSTYFLRGIMLFSFD